MRCISDDLGTGWIVQYFEGSVDGFDLWVTIFRGDLFSCSAFLNREMEA